MQEKQNNLGLVWFRNDLRTKDNNSLKEATKNHTSVIAVYCFDPRHFEITKYGFKKIEKYRAKFLIETIENLKSNLAALNIELFLYTEKPEISINQLVETHEINAIYLQKEWTSEEVEVIENVKYSVSREVKFYEFYDQFLYHPHDIHLLDSEIPEVFTNFRNSVEKNAAIRSSIKIKATQPIKGLVNNTKIPKIEDLGLESFETPTNTAFPFKGGETNALERLQHYFFKTKKLGFYKKTRNGLIGSDYSSKFSAWLSNGSISARTIYWQVKKFEKDYFKNESTYWLIFELIWRDYFKYISLKHKNNIFKLGGILQKNYDWLSDEKLINQWVEGKTSSAFVNANMIELKKTGWMSNRGRQNVASFFTKDMLLDWRIGAAYFEAMLIDYDVNSNYGNWMYVAGVGNDPRDRKFNTKLQAERYDPNGKYQNLWLQETLF